VITLFDELSRSKPPKLKREGVRLISNEPEPEFVRQSPDEVREKEDKVKAFMLLNQDRLIGTVELVHSLQLPRAAIANIAAKFWRHGWIDVTRVKKKVYYRYLGGF
jgi:hypothetical protein